VSTVSYERYNPELYELPAGPILRKQKSPEPRKVPGKISRRPKRRKISGKTGREFTARGFITLLIIVLSSALALEVVFHLVVAPRLVIRHIQIDPGRGQAFSEEALLAAAGITGKIHYFDVDPELISRRLLTLPFVRKTEVTRVFPDTLSITVTQREALAAVLIDTGDDVVPALIDREGVLFRLGVSESVDLPIISGIRFENPKPGMVIPEVLTSFLGDMERIKQTSPVLLTLISEFKLIKKDGNRYEVMLYPENYRVPVRIGDRLDERTLNYVMMVLDVVLLQGMTADLEEIDFRSGDVAFRKREG